MCNCKILVLFNLITNIYVTISIFQDNVIHKLEALSLCIQFWCMCSVLAKCFKCINVSLDRLRIRKNQGNYLNCNQIIMKVVQIQNLSLLERIIVMDKPPDLFILSDHFTLPTNIVVHLRQLNRAHIDLCSILEHINNVYQVTDTLKRNSEHK